jgi:UDP-GlcNAc:undecaprenyl-phosphate GlcNAc-1-phosphate transferase
VSSFSLSFHITPGVFFGLFLFSFFICWTLIRIQPWVERHLRDRDDLRSVQCAHVHVTPRVGGLGVVATTLVVLVFVVAEEHQPYFTLFAVSLLPVFIAGLSEDLGWRVTAFGRLCAAGVSAVLAIALLRIWIPPLALPGIDMVFQIAPLAIILTVLWSTGVCHAFNLIDGVNGFAGALGLLIAVGLTLVANQAGAEGFALVASAIIPSVLGFLLLNWPLGRIFLGDAGAYSLGHVLVWLAIGLAWYVPDVSALALALMFFWPVADTMLAIGRRLRKGRPVGAPDRLHFHQLVMRALLLISAGRLSRGAANSTTTLVVLPLAALPIGAGIMLWDRPGAALMAWLVFGVTFFGAYLAGVRVFRAGPWRWIARRVERRAALRDDRKLAHIHIPTGKK